MNKKPIIAFLYDLTRPSARPTCRTIRSSPRSATRPASSGASRIPSLENRMDGLLAYMYTMIEECRKRHPPGPRLPRLLRACDRAVPRRAGLVLAHQRLRRNAGRGDRALRAILRPARDHRGQRREHEFKEIYACEFFYNEEGLASWPKLDVNFTNKTQFVYRINKGILDVAKDKELNASMPDDSKRIPFTNMIYIATAFPTCRA
mgnify:CR=1 FL=1